MTAIESTGKTSGKKSFFGKTKQHSIRIDMTPMVDLGFLLITFFIYTSALSEPSSMNLIMPDDSGHPTPTKNSGALTLIPVENRWIYYYEGNLREANVKKVSIGEIRNIIITKKKQTPVEDLYVIIKPSKEANYRNVVDLLDEMIISGIKRYALVKINEEESRRLDNMRRVSIRVIDID